MSDSLWGWRNSVASPNGPSSATTRLVLLCLSLHFDDGGRAWPSTRLLAERTGLSERAVVTHLDIALSSGWISRRRRGLSPRGWCYEYVAATPKVLNVVQCQAAQGAERGSVPSGGNTWHGTERHSEGAERPSSKVLNEVQQNTTKNTTKNTTEGSPYGDAFTAVAVPAGGKKRGRDRSGGRTKRTNAKGPAQRVVSYLHAELQAHDVADGVGAGQRWGAAVRIAGSALESATVDDLEAAIAWGFADPHWTARLRADRAKVLRAVWAAWLDRDRTPLQNNTKATRMPLAGAPRNRPGGAFADAFAAAEDSG